MQSAPHSSNFDSADDPITMHYFILPRQKRLQLEAKAAKRDCAPELLIEEAIEKTGKNAALAARVEQKAKEICASLQKGRYHLSLWPRSLSECLIVAVGLNKIYEQYAEQRLLEMSEVELDQVEAVCIERGISYDEFAAETILAVYQKGGLRTENEEEEDPSDWWKNA